MNPNIQTRIDSKRGCGWRKPGGLYLISGGVSAPCGILPIPLHTCPTCSSGIKATRGWTWIQPGPLVASKQCAASPDRCQGCPMSQRSIMSGRHGLLWIGGSFYEKPSDWTDEAIRQGVSRRIQAVPKDFKLGETWVFVAHREASRETCPDCKGTGKKLDDQNVILEGSPACEPCKGKGTVPQPAIFHAFMPTAIEYVVKGDETDEQIDAIIKRGITPVQVQHDEPEGDQPSLLAEEDETEVQA
jgi:hypothetical protein